MSRFAKLRSWAREIKRDIVALWFAYRHPATPLLAKALCMAILAYALSPIDLIPDFIPVLGYLDDVLILPALIWLAVKLVPAEILSLSREEARKWLGAGRDKPRSFWGAALVIAIWLGLAWVLWKALIASSP